MAAPSSNPRTDHAPGGTVTGLSAVSALGRIAIGVGLALAPRAALSALGFRNHDAATVAIARIAGGRDIALGAATLAALGDPDRLRTANIANAAVDAGDAVSFGAALASGDESVRDAGLRGLAVAVPAALGGAYLAARAGQTGSMR